MPNDLTVKERCDIREPQEKISDQIKTVRFFAIISF